MVEGDVGPGPPRSWYLAQDPLPVLGVTSAAALAGGGLLHIATRLPNAMIGLVGVVVATVAAFIATDYTAARWRQPQRRRWRAFVFGCAVVGAVLVVVSNVLAWPFPAFAGLMALTIGVSPLVAEVREDAEDGAERWMEGGLGVSLVATVVLAFPGTPGAVRLGAVIAVLVGLGFFTGGLSAHCATGAAPRSPVLQIFPGDAARRGVIAAALGAVAFVVGVVAGVPVVAYAASWLVVASMITLSVSPRRFGLSQTMQRAVFGAGIVLVLVAGYQLFTTGTLGRSAWFVGFVVATIALAGAWIVWRGATLFIAVLVGFAFVWGLFSNTTTDDGLVSEAPDGGDQATAGLVAFGDSFISGEGAPRFFDGTDQKGSKRNECRRAPTAYPVLVSLDDDGATHGGLAPISGLDTPGLDFYACSGAKLAQVLDTSSESTATGEPVIESAAAASVPCDVPDEVVEVGLGQYPCGPDGVYGAVLQLENLPQSAAGLDRTQLVLISIGGNDVRFGDIVAGCLLPGSCAERREVWLDNVAALGPELTKGYEKIRMRFDPDETGEPAIVVMPYPLVLTEQTCAASPLDASEHEFVYEFTTVLNQQIATSAAQAGVHFFDRGPFAFEGHRLCERGDRAINLIGLQPTAGPLLDRLNPGSWTHNSMHPNELGHRLTAEALTEWLNEHEVLEKANPTADPTASTELLGVRTARPYAVAPSVLRTLQSAPVDGCDFGQIQSFATRVAVFDEQPDDGAEQPFRVPIAGADPTATICATDATGNWIALTPTEGTDEMNAPSQLPTATVQDGRVFITGGRPAPGCPPDENDDGACAFQWVLFAPPVPPAIDDDGDLAGDDGGVDAAALDPSERAWSLRAVRYCSTDPDCESTFAEWSDAQVAQAARKVAPTVAMIFLGGWLIALGWNLCEKKPFSAGIRRFLARITGSSIPADAVD